MTATVSVPAFSVWPPEHAPHKTATSAIPGILMFMVPERYPMETDLENWNATVALTV
jgi:hypothetical protein